MKAFIAIFLILFAAPSLQQRQNTTEELRAQQRDLLLSHTFFELSIVQNREQISSQFYLISREVIRAHLGHYAVMRTASLQLIDGINAVEVTELSEECLQNLRLRLNLQMNRYGDRFANCMRDAFNLFRDHNSYINTFTNGASLTGSQVQNIGVSVLSNTDDFTGENSFSATINHELRNFLGIALPYSNHFNAFLRTIQADVLDTIARLINCDEGVEYDFLREVPIYEARTRACANLNQI